MSRSEVRRRLREALGESHRQTGRLGEPGFPETAFEALQAFQRERLGRTYADLAAQDRYSAAVAFFLDELYGGRDARDRDRQVEEALPIMQRTLPSSMQRTLADAFRLQGLSMELDIALAEARAKEGGATMDTETYVRLYSVVPRARREEQIHLIHDLALELDRVVHLPFVLGLITAMRGPAGAMGFGALQAFLERGLRSFRAMHGAETFAETVRTRELRIMVRLYAGREDPFDLGDGGAGTQAPADRA